MKIFWAIRIIGLVLLVQSCGGEETNAEEPATTADAKLVHEGVEFTRFTEEWDQKSLRLGERLYIRFYNLNAMPNDGGKLDLSGELEIWKGDSLVSKSGDLFGNAALTEEEKCSPEFYFDAFPPIRVGEGYRLRISMKDNVTNKRLTLERTFDIKSPLKNGFLEVENKGVEVSDLIIYRGNMPYSGNIYGLDERFFAYFTVDKEFLANEPAVELNMVVKDSEGNRTFESAESGTLTSETGPLNVYLVFSDEKFERGNAYTINFELKQVNGDASIQMQMPIKIES